MSNLEHIIESLEKSLRSWRNTTLVLVGALLIALTCAATLPDKTQEVFRTRRLEVLAPDGCPAAVLSADKNSSYLTLTHPGAKRERVITLAATAESVHLILMKHKEAPVLVAQGDDTGSSLTLFDGREPSQTPRSICLASVMPTKNTVGGTSINLTRGQHKDSVQAGLYMADPPLGSALYLAGSPGQGASLRVNQQSGKVELLDQKNNPFWSTP